MVKKRCTFKNLEEIQKTWKNFQNTYVHPVFTVWLIYILLHLIQIAPLLKSMIFTIKTDVLKINFSLS